VGLAPADVDVDVDVDVATGMMGNVSCCKSVEWLQDGGNEPASDTGGAKVEPAKKGQGLGAWDDCR
jgi:hypothetical protein